MRAFFRLLGQGKLTVLMFHKVPVLHDGLFPHEPDLARFSLLLQFVRENFRVISLAEAVAGLKGNNLPAAAACLTFDDGYSDWFQGVVPLLAEQGVPATFFITTSQLLGEPVWYERISHAVRHCQAPEVDLRAIGLEQRVLAGDDDKARLVRELEELCKYRSLGARSEMLDALKAILGGSDLPVPCMSVEELRRLVSLGFEVGAHTVNHPILRFCSPSEAEFEIAAARETIEHLTGVKVSAFAYPNGKVGLDVLPEHVDFVRRCGYSCALTTEPGVASGGMHLLQIPRFTPWGETRQRMALQMGRNLFCQPEFLPESSHA